MLINKKYDADTIVSFKIVNGDELVAKVVEETDEAFLISKPCTVMPSPQGLGLMQSIFTSELNNSVVLHKSHVMLHAVTADQIKNHYIQTTTGIQPVSNGGIIT